MYVRVGADNTNDDGERVEVAKVVKHPKSDYVQYDMAILELKTPLKYSNRVRPIKLPKEGEFLKTGTLVTVTGYGVTNKANYKNTLEMVEVPVMDRDECGSYYTGLLKEFMFCAGYKQGGKDSCQVKHFVRDKRVDLKCLHFREIPVDHWFIKAYCLG